MCVCVCVCVFEGGSRGRRWVYSVHYHKEHYNLLSEVEVVMRGGGGGDEGEEGVVMRGRRGW